MGNETTNFPQPPYSAGYSMHSATAPPPSPPGSSSPLHYAYEPQAPPPPGPPPPPPPQVPVHPPLQVLVHPSLQASVNSPSDNLTEPAPHKSPSMVKTIVATITTLVSILAVALTYATFLQQNQIFPNPEGPLAASVIFSSVALLCAISLCTLPRTPIAMGGLVPLLLSVLSGSLLVLFFAAVQSHKNGNGYLLINYTAVLISAVMFGGMSSGSLITYVMFAKNVD